MITGAKPNEENTTQIELIPDLKEADEFAPTIFEEVDAPLRPVINFSCVVGQRENKCSSPTFPEGATQRELSSTESSLKDDKTEADSSPPQKSVYIVVSCNSIMLSLLALICLMKSIGKMISKSMDMKNSQERSQTSVITPPPMQTSNSVSSVAPPSSPVPPVSRLSPGLPSPTFGEISDETVVDPELLDGELGPTTNETQGMSGLSQTLSELGEPSLKETEAMSSTTSADSKKRRNKLKRVMTSVVSPFKRVLRRKKQTDLNADRLSQNSTNSETPSKDSTSSTQKTSFSIKGFLKFAYIKKGISRVGRSKNSQSAPATNGKYIYVERDRVNSKEQKITQYVPKLKKQ